MSIFTLIPKYEGGSELQFYRSNLRKFIRDSDSIKLNNELSEALQYYKNLCNFDLVLDMQITFMLDDGLTAYGIALCGKDEFINAPQSPTSIVHSYYQFDGWYTTLVGPGNKISFPYYPTNDIKLYSRFIESQGEGVCS
jgi:uncharacterized repeat protein (TIGR02543 family)